MKEPNFPDAPPPGSKKTPTTIENVQHLLDCKGIAIRYNVIRKKDEIVIPEHQGTPDNLDNVALSEIVSVASRYGLPTGHIPEFVKVIADRNAYNPVADWIRSRSWDGQDRLADIYASVIEQPDYPVHLKQVLIRKWLRSAVAAALVPGYKGRGVLTLQGPQRIGKTSWIKALVSDPVLRDSVVKIDHHIDGSNKDSVITAVSHWITELGELDSSFKKDIARLKGFLTADYDKLRRPYDKRDSEYPRRTVFAATVNEATFLVDPTGNSRWWTIAVDKLDYEHGIDSQQLFAQAWAEVEAGRKWWLTDDEEAMLAAWNDRHAAPSVVVETVMSRIDLGSDRNVQRVTPTELLRISGIDRPTNQQAKECGALLRQLIGPPTKVEGIYKWRVPIREPSTEDLGVTLNTKGLAVAPGEIF